MNKVYICIGLPASGKSSWAKQKVIDSCGQIKRVNKDDLRAMIDCSKWSKANEKLVLKIRDEIIVNALTEKRDVIVDDTNLSPKHLDHIRELVKPFNADVLPVSFLDVPLEECIKRDKNRPNYVGEDGIKKMYRQFIVKKSQPLQVIYDVSLDDAVWCDLDGSLAIMGNRSPYEENLCSVDVVNKPVAVVVDLLKKSGHKIIICTGRDEGRGRDATEKWLLDNGIQYDLLYMRKSMDRRKDSIVKMEMYENYIKNKFNLLVCFDDRDQVVSMLRGLGLPVFQVNYGDF